MKSIVESILSSTKTGYSVLLYKAIEYVLRDFTNYGEYEEFIMPIYIIGKGNCKNFKEYKTRLEEGNIIYGNDKELNEILLKLCLIHTHFPLILALEFYYN